MRIIVYQIMCCLLRSHQSYDFSNKPYDSYYSITSSKYAMILPMIKSSILK